MLGTSAAGVEATTCCLTSTDARPSPLDALDTLFPAMPDVLEAGSVVAGYASPA